MVLMLTDVCYKVTANRVMCCHITQSHSLTASSDPLSWDRWLQTSDYPASRALMQLQKSSGRWVLVEGRTEARRGDLSREAGVKTTRILQRDFLILFSYSVVYTKLNPNDNGLLIKSQLRGCTEWGSRLVACVPRKIDTLSYQLLRQIKYLDIQ